MYRNISLQKMSVDKRYRIFYIFTGTKNASFGKNRKLCTLKVSALACVGSDVWSFWYRWNEFLVKFTRFFAWWQKSRFFIKQIFFQQVFSVEKMENVRGAQSFSGNNSALKKYFECSKLPFSIFLTC